MAHLGNIASLSLFYRYCFGRYLSELAQLAPLPFSAGSSARYSDTLLDLFVTTPRCYKDVNVNNFFPCSARCWNSLPIECFPLTYDLNGFKYRITRHLITIGSFQRDFLYAIIFCVSFTSNSVPCTLESGIDIRPSQLIFQKFSTQGILIPRMFFNSTSPGKFQPRPSPPPRLVFSEFFHALPLFQPPPPSPAPSILGSGCSVLHGVNPDIKKICFKFACVFF